MYSAMTPLIAFGGLVLMGVSGVALYALPGIYEARRQRRTAFEQAGAFFKLECRPVRETYPPGMPVEVQCTALNVCNRPLPFWYDTESFIALSDAGEHFGLEIIEEDDRWRDRGKHGTTIISPRDSLALWLRFNPDFNGDFTGRVIYSPVGLLDVFNKVSRRQAAEPRRLESGEYIASLPESTTCYFPRKGKVEIPSSIEGIPEYLGKSLIASNAFCISPIDEHR